MVHNIYTASAVDQARKEQAKRVDRAFVRRLTYAALGLSIAQFWFAQMIVWGLSTFHIDSGILGIWLLLEGGTSAIASAVGIGMLRAVRDLQKVQSES